VSYYFAVSALLHLAVCGWVLAVWATHPSCQCVRSTHTPDRR